MSEFNFDYLALVRHGHAQHNHAADLHKSGLEGAYDEVITRPSSLHKLTDRGEAEARETGAWIMSQGLWFTQYVVSDMVRALQTAQRLGLPDARWEIEARLCEKESGVLNTFNPLRVTRYFKRITNKHHELDNYHFRPERGESFLDVEVRVRSVLASLSRGRPLVVGHGLIIGFIDSVLFGGNCAWDFGSYQSMHEIPNGAVIEYERLGDGVWQRRMSVPSRSPEPGVWEKIIPPQYSNEGLGELVSRALGRLS